jgi:ribose transport system permease protein
VHSETTLSVRKPPISAWRRWIHEPEFRIGIVFIIFYIISSFLSDGFFTAINQKNLFRQISIEGIVAIGMTFVFITRGIDLSVGSIMGLVATTALLLQDSLDLAPIILICLLIGCTAGLINGLFIGLMRLDSFLVTLSTWMIYRGLCFLLSRGERLSGTQDGYEKIGQGYVCDIPVPVIIFILLVVISQLVLFKTWYGRAVRYIGGNETAALYSGFRVPLLRTLTFTLSGLFCAIAAVVFSSRFGVVYPLETGAGYEFTTIAAVVLGGTTFLGGKGSIIGTFIGIMIISLLQNILNLMDVSPYYHKFVTGVIIVAAVIMQHLRKDST